MATRFLPFLIFPEGKNPPDVVRYLGTVLPYAVISLLVVYCLKGVPESGSYGIPEAIAIVFIIFLHKWKKKYPAFHRWWNYPLYGAGTAGVLNDTILMQTFCRMARYEEGEKMCNAENIDCRG